MPMKLNAVTGLKIVGAANIWPQDVLGDSARLSNPQVYRAFLGSDWQEVVKERSLDIGWPAHAYGVNARGWTRGSSIGSLELGIAAADKVLAESGCRPEDIDCIIAATSTPNYITSSLAGKIAKHLNIGAAALDIRSGGAAGLNAMTTAATYHANGCKVSLIVAAEAGSKYLGQHDLSNGLLFGDGASALVVRSDASAGEAGLLGSVVGNFSWAGRAFTVPGKLPPDLQSTAEDFVWQKPDATYLAHLSQSWELAGRQLRDAFPGHCASLSAFLPYAVTKDQVLSAAAPFGAPCDISLRLLSDHGCLGCTSPLASLVEYWREYQRPGKTCGGQTIASLAVAGGISWAGLLWQL